MNRILAASAAAVVFLTAVVGSTPRLCSLRQAQDKAGQAGSPLNYAKPSAKFNKKLTIKIANEAAEAMIRLYQ
jgi:hypothetical protein